MFLAPALHAQTCATGQTFFKNDVLPANPGSAAVSVIEGLCEGEACGCVFDVSSVGPVVKLKSAAVGYVQAGGVNGTASDLEVTVTAHSGLRVIPQLSTGEYESPCPARQRVRPSLG